jgi:hypothetical protein
MTLAAAGGLLSGIAKDKSLLVIHLWITGVSQFEI